MIPKLQPNPFSRAWVRYRDGKAIELRVWSVTRSRGALTRNFARGGRADFDQICDIAMRGSVHGGNDRATSVGDFAVLAALGLWAAEPDLIDPIFVEAPIRSEAARRKEPVPIDELALCGEVWLEDASGPSLAIPDAPLLCLSPARPILWHRRSPIEPAWPWWPDASCLAALEAVQRGEPPPPRLWPAVRALTHQGILTSHTALRAAELDRRRFVEAGHACFVRDGLADLGQVLPAGQLAAFQRYWRRLSELQVLPERGDNRRGSHGEPSSMLLLHMLKPLVEHLVGSPIEAAFSYSWIYEPGTEMPPHRDRTESRYTVSLLLDYMPASDGPTSWPLVVRSRGHNSPIEIRQTVGDALLFCGEELEHSRPPFTMGERSISLLLHYVDRNFTGKLF
jgi:hypothetical protein